MQFLTESECKEWLRPGQRDENGWLTEFGEERLLTKGELGFTCGHAMALASIFSHDGECLLWVSASRIWNGNLHLYYRFRESYGDHRLVEAAPGHLFLQYEKADLLSYIQIAIQCGWDFWVLGGEDYARLMVSHDEYFIASVSTQDQLDSLIPE